jgi:hypothetical protein
MSISKRRIGFYALELKPFEKGEDISFEKFLEVIENIQKGTNIEKRVDIPRSHKFYFLDSFEKGEKKAPGIYYLTFKSAKYMHRPPLINRDTLSERNNPKELEEGETEKTHIALKFDNSTNEVICGIEERKSGITINQFVSYIERFNKKIREDKGNEKNKNNFFIKVTFIVGEDFLKKLEKLDKIKICELYIETSRVGSEFLEMAHISDTRKYSTITLRAKTRGSLKESIEQGYQLFKGGKVERVKAVGYSEDNDRSILDTDALRKIEYIEVDSDEETNQVNTDSIKAGLEKLLIRVKNESHKS